MLFYGAFLYGRNDNNNDTPQLLDDNKRRRDRQTPRILIWKYPYLSFLYLFNSGNKQSLINCCAYNHNSFCLLLEMFASVFHLYTFDKWDGRIRKKKLTQEGKPKG